MKSPVGVGQTHLKSSKNKQSELLKNLSRSRRDLIFIAPGETRGIKRKAYNRVAVEQKKGYLYPLNALFNRYAVIRMGRLFSPGSTRGYEYSTPFRGFGRWVRDKGP